MPRKRRSRKKGTLPKGAYRLPTGGYVTKPIKHVTPNGRHIAVHAVRRDQPDIRLLASAFLQIAKDLAEKERTEKGSDRAA